MDLIGVGVVGWGLGGRGFHGGFIRAVDGFELRAVVTSRDVDIDRVADVKSLIARDDIDLVVVASPNALHAEHARSALDAQKHVVVDKPVCRSVSELDSLAEAARQNGRHLVPFQNRRWDGDFMTVKRLLEDGRFGHVHYLASRWPTYRPSTEARSAWKAEADPMNGVLFDLGPHLVDQAIVLFGRPTTVWAQVETRRPKSAVVDLFRIHLGYADRTVRLELDQLDPFEPARFVVIGSDGAYEKTGIDVQEDGIRGEVAPMGEGWGVEPRARWGRLVTPDGETRIETERGDYKHFYRGVRDLIRGEGSTPVAIEDVRLQLEILEAAERSSRSGRTEELRT